MIMDDGDKPAKPKPQRYNYGRSWVPYALATLMVLVVVLWIIGCR